MGQRTPLFDSHVDAGARIVDFGGWDMPLHFGSQLEEHRLVRNACGMFDVSHMTVVDVLGNDARAYLQTLLANDVDKIQAPGGALYSCMLNESGGVVDDLIVYWQGGNAFRLIVNAATRAKDLAWIEQQSDPFEAVIRERPELAMIAVQGPLARDKVAGVAGEGKQVRAIKRFHSARVGTWMIARTGYTGEDGFEVLVPADEAASVWQALESAGVAPCGLGARDSLRLEAGLNLYGQDMDETVSPLESNLAWTVAWEPPGRSFIGRDALVSQRGSDHAELVGLALRARGVLRHGQSVLSRGKPIGAITSGGFGPTLGASVALARLAPGPHENVQVDVRGRCLAAEVVSPPFVRGGKATFSV